MNLRIPTNSTTISAAANQQHQVETRRKEQSANAGIQGNHHKTTPATPRKEKDEVNEKAAKIRNSPRSQITPLNPDFTLPQLTRQQCCKWIDRQEDLLFKLQHPKSYSDPLDMNPQIQFILASNLSTVHEREYKDCIEIFCKEIVLRVETS